MDVIYAPFQSIGLLEAATPSTAKVTAQYDTVSFVTLSPSDKTPHSELVSGVFVYHLLKIETEDNMVCSCSPVKN
jgi:hypothetical protein